MSTSKPTPNKGRHDQILQMVGMLKAKKRLAKPSEVWNNSLCVRQVSSSQMDPPCNTGRYATTVSNTVSASVPAIDLQRFTHHVLYCGGWQLVAPPVLSLPINSIHTHGLSRMGML